MLEEQPSSRVNESLRHSIANMIIGFLLTGVIGTSLIQYYSIKQQDEAQYQQKIKARKQAVSRLSSLNGEALSHTERLLQAIELGESGSRNELTKLYDGTLSHWKSENHSTWLIACDALPMPADYQ